MFDMRNLVRRHFEVILPDGTHLEVEPPKMKVLRKMISLAQQEQNGELENEAFDDLLSALSLALSKNKQRQQISKQYLDAELNLDEVQALLISYFDWVSEIHDEKN